MPSTPDFTPAQIVAALSAVIGLLVTDGWIDGRLGKLITGLATIVIPFALLIADAIIRHGRAKMHGEIQAAKVLAGQAVTPPE